MHIIQSKISQERSKIMNFCKRSYHHILRYLYTEIIKRGGEISLHKHFKRLEILINRDLPMLVLFFTRNLSKTIIVLITDRVCGDYTVKLTLPKSEKETTYLLWMLMANMAGATKYNKIGPVVRSPFSLNGG